ncbi:NADH dehydrogenase [ubiquinone] 1 alpha subcomplex subunit 8 [Bombus terrestris]|uniref:NADH dehydrogenase [ubiquinone] 1 alpha subcomplex subunit 8 n=1 Tax=Bombus terrestris TaxID=30195 RepID=A0A9B2JVW9_BOMTE|nr:NADH dehydrogenase [ubiquinone] 1 alpha subcomplex subunit 8 [Bombus terrestris]XP_012175017.1 NADH dehydrogenase [ubiquinone] 1 alpha subcomplex subunit 8 [Bombus terrestris]
MTNSKNFKLPSDEELNTQELNISWPYIAAAAVFLAKRCEWFNNEFMLCRYELKDPRKCLKEGKEVTKCAIEGFQDIKKHCGSEFQAHVDCVINTSSTATDDEYCSKTRQVFDDCMVKNLKLERPPFGYFCEAKVHDSPRPKPPQEERGFPDAVPQLPTPPYPPPKYSGRGGFNM